MSRLVDELRQLAPVKRNAALTDAEIASIIDGMRSAARQQAARGQRQFGWCLDDFLRHGERAALPVPRQRIPAVELYFQEQGMRAVFSNDMTCGFCNIRDCNPKAHFGYIVEWDADDSTK